MSCKPICTLCRKLRISQNVTFSNDTLIINLPAGSYNDGEKICIIVAQSIPILRTRTRYSVCVSTTATGGTFKLIGKPCCAPNNRLTSINGTAPTTPATPAAATASVETSAKGVK